MDLHGWMLADLSALRGRLFEGVIARVPDHLWAEPLGGGSSLNHLILHLARHHDLAVNTAIRNHAPLYAEHRDALGLGDAPPGAALPETEMRAVTSELPSAALRDYTSAVFDHTQEWLEHLGSMVLDTVPDTGRRFRRLAGLPEDEFSWLYAMWSGKAVWWLVQWPVLGHGHNHVGEATGLRNRMGLSPF